MVSRTSILGGESKSRGLLGGRRARGVVGAWIILGLVAAVLILFLQLIGFFIGAVAALVLFVMTMDPGNGSSPFKRLQDRRRMRYRRRQGFDDFVHVSWRPDDLVATAGATRKERSGNQRTWNTYRDWPDGVDGLYWLESRPGRPCVAYHGPVGESPYLSVAFSVDGPIQGLHGDTFVAEAQYEFGQLMAGWGASQKLVSGIQIVTRVLPSDSAFHEVWLEEQLDPAAPEELQAGYGELLDQLSAASFVQRHYVVIRWNVDNRFAVMASRRAPGLEGFLEVIQEQTASVHRRLVDAMYSKVHPLSGPQLGAALRHLQHPDWPIDRASDVNIDSCWLPSHDDWSSTEVISESPDPLNPDLMMAQSGWLHRTAAIPVEGLEVRPIDGLWMSPLLTGMEEQIVRTISTHIQFVPAREAKIGARRDATSDRADIISQERKGRIVDDDAELALSAAVRRFEDLRDGGGHHGAVWTAFITVSARKKDELNAACSHVEEAADGAGINRLDWLDTLQSAAQATTWPLGRGMATPKRSGAVRTAERLSTSTNKEAISA